MFPKSCLVLLPFVFHLTKSQDHLCEEQDTCDSCMEASPNCRWCSKEGFKPRRCNTEENLRMQNCGSEFIVNEELHITISDPITTDNYIIGPETVTVDFRGNKIFNFEITVNLKKYLPVETVIIMDFSYTMLDLFNEMKNKVSDLTTKGMAVGLTRIGYAKYVDKMLHPAIRPGQHQPKPGERDAPFNFGIISELSDKSNILLDKLRLQLISVNADAHESATDAIVQAVKCRQMGWTNSKSVMKTVVLMTDAFTKMATDGKILGVIAKHDLKCHVDESTNIDEKGDQFDYPSIGQMGYVLRETQTEMIFAVTKPVMKYYQAITNSLIGVNAVVTELNMATLDVLDIILQSRKKLNSRIVLNFAQPNNLKVTVTPICKTASGTECSGVGLEDPIKFVIHCETINAEGENSLKFYISSLATVTLHYNKIKTCGCSRKPQPQTNCKNGGEAFCGACKCKPPFAGPLCECESKKVDERACKNPQTDSICSGKGKCDACGTCSCYAAPNGEPYSGDYCQCEKLRCEKFNGELCGGDARGQCECNDCKCEPDFYGKACENLNCESQGMVEKCKAKDDTNVCSGVGDCLCGECKCPITRKGTYCEDEVQIDSCDTYKDAVSCFLSKKPVNKDYACDTETVPIAGVSDESVLTRDEDFQCVKTDSDKCDMFYNYVIENEKVTRIVVKARDTKTDCQKPINILLVTGLAFLAVVLIGLIVLGGFFVSLYLYHRAEYRKYLKETQTQGTGTANPLYEQVVQAGT